MKVAVAILLGVAALHAATILDPQCCLIETQGVGFYNSSLSEDGLVVIPHYGPVEDVLVFCAPVYTTTYQPPIPPYIPPPIVPPVIPPIEPPGPPKSEVPEPSSLWLFPWLAFAWWWAGPHKAKK